MIRAILIDDDWLALQQLKKRLSEFESVKVVTIFSNAEDFLIVMKQLDFQVVFLDIQMPGMSGLDLAKIIKDWKKDIYIVFVTAHRDYAIEAFELHSIDYLLKPILKHRLEKTITRIQEQMQLKTRQPSPNPPTLPAMKVICFDEFVVYNQNEPVKWKTAKVKELFAFFITNLNAYVHRDTIIDQLWPEHDYKKSKIQLHTSISHLRKTLSSLGYEQVLTFSNQSYALVLDEFQCDAINLERMIDQHSKVDHENILSFEQAVQQYHGSYMDKNSYGWTAVKSQHIQQKLLQLLQKMINYYSKYDELDKENHYLQTLLKHNPYSEHPLQQLMLHYASSGRRGDAVKVYQDFTKTLLEDIKISPEPATKEIYESIILNTIKVPQN